MKNVKTLINTLIKDVYKIHDREDMLMHSSLRILHTLEELYPEHSGKVKEITEMLLNPPPQEENCHG